MVSMLRSVTHHTAASPSPSNSIGPGSQVVPSDRDTRRDPRPVSSGVRTNTTTNDWSWLDSYATTLPSTGVVVAASRDPTLKPVPPERGEDGAVAGGLDRFVARPVELDRSERRRDERRRERRGDRDAPSSGKGHRRRRGVSLAPLVVEHRHHAIAELGRRRPLHRGPEHLQPVVERLQLATARATPSEMLADLEVFGVARRTEHEVREERAHVLTRRHAPPPSRIRCPTPASPADAGAPP